MLIVQQKKTKIHGVMYDCRNRIMFGGCGVTESKNEKEIDNRASNLEPHKSEEKVMKINKLLLNG